MLHCHSGKDWYDAGMMLSCCRQRAAIAATLGLKVVWCIDVRNQEEEEERSE